MQNAKFCCIPVCEGEKFHLVHKFPSDRLKFLEWMTLIELADVDGRAPKIMKGLSQEDIKKKFFICCRHFSVDSYKNKDSRSLNTTAVPNLNLASLNDLKLSKAYQLEHQAAQIPLRIPAVHPQTFKILNSTLSKPSIPIKILNQQPREHDNPEHDNPVVIKQNMLPPKRPATALIKTTSPKKIKIQQEPILKLCETKEDVSSSEKKKEKTAEDPICKFTKKNQETTIIENHGEPQPHQNKLLALIEVTPDQYQELNQKMSAAERTEKLGALISLFVDNENPGHKGSVNSEIEIKIDDDKTIFVDLMWLRDHCRCNECYNVATFQRKTNILELPDDISIKSSEFEDGKLTVIWYDNHKSEYLTDFLMKYQFGAQPPSSLQKQELWAFETELQSICRCKMRDYMSDPKVTKGVLGNLHKYGVSFIDGVQPTQQSTEFVIRQLFPIHRTLFGEMWTFSDEKLEHADTAYTTYYLGPHNDNTYFNDASGLQILHCITKQCTGGANFLIDGFQVAEKIREEHPEVFKRLTTTLVPAEYIEENRHHKYMAPIIKLHPLTNEIEQIRFNTYDRAPMNTVPKEKIRQFYSDLKLIATEMENPQNRITFNLEPGTVMIFDNYRILHGRHAFCGKRTMTGCYVQRTEYLSSLRSNGFIE